MRLRRRKLTAPDPTLGRPLDLFDLGRLIGFPLGGLIDRIALTSMGRAQA